MATTPLGLCSSFLKGETNSKFLPSIRFSSPPFPSSQLSLHSIRRSSSITAAKPVTTETSKREPRGIMKPRPVSPEMQAFLGGGVTEIARTEVLKKIWAYIKQQELQDPENKKIIICDENLKKIFDNKERVGFLEVAKLISPHFVK